MSTDADAAAERRGLLVADIVARTGIDEPLIERVVRAFYGRVAADAALGPIFAARIGDWEAHILRMGDFWSSVALMSGRYHGQPLAAHLDLPVEARHFDRWLELFAATVQELCRPEAAAFFLERARRIAASFQLGIAARHGRPPPPRRA